MNDHRYRLGTDFLFRESDKPYQRLLRFLGVAALCAFVFTLICYAVFSLTINTDLEGRLKRENKMYEKLYPQLLPQQKLLNDAVAGLELKDSEIYSEVFQSVAPSVDPIQSITAFSDDEDLNNISLISYASAKSDSMYAKMFAVEAKLRSSLVKVATVPAKQLPPMHLPLSGISFTQLGASIGQKTNPVLKARVTHNGLDIIVSSGTPVYASGYGTVVNVEKSNKGLGNSITIAHESGHITKYSHLATMTVKRGSKVSCGQKIGTTGMTGSSFAPHLHYEVLKDGKYLDPVNFFFADVDFYEYANMFYIASNTEQSMD